MRRRGYDPESAQDLTQGFFTRLLEKESFRAARQERGKFRSFLLASVKHYLSNQHDREQAAKRGGSQLPFSLDFEMEEGRYAVEPADANTPERLFQKQWALTLLDRILEQLEEEMKHGGQEKRFERLQGFLIRESGATPYKEVAAELEMSESAVRMAVHRMRGRFGKLLRAEIAHTVSKPEKIGDEVRHLLAAVGP